ncbi:hypothetical protein [Haladaptatus pallidirubidus]|uniref:SPW repeat-containing protein n=1 Tax=Haladaptatus pallidirubidus TaxID=1008152 RepID=A0AAV3UKN6_9EURY|nr:hypothetical protein [Haladaptatus pallidirubidus]
MTEGDRSNFGGLWNGLSYITVGLLAMAIFVFSGSSVDTGRVVASIALVAIGVAAFLAQRISPWFADLHRYWTGLFWALCGLGILGIGVVSSSTANRWIGGGVIGGGLVIYGILVASGG